MTKARLMIVEDEGLIGASIRVTLENFGYTVTSVEMSGTDAIEGAQRDQPDLILMDIKLHGDMDGITAAQEIIRRFDIPVVYLTAHMDDEIVERAKITEPYAYIIKPFSERELFTNIEIGLYKHSMEKKLKEMAITDKVTGLMNRPYFIEWLHKIIIQSARDNQTFALLYLDLDGFKYVNDTMGHDGGDILLQKVAARLIECSRKSDILGRLGGDEFCLIVRNILNPEDASLVASKINEAIANPFILNDIKYSITVSIGISIYPTDGFDSETLLKKADTAMYFIKRHDKNSYLYFSALREKDTVNLASISALSAAFVIENKAAWNQSAWLEFLLSIKDLGIITSTMLQRQLGLLLEALRRLYFIIDYEGTKKDIIGIICDNSADFILSTRGAWKRSDWENLLFDLEGQGIFLNDQKMQTFREIVEILKTIYIMV